MKKSIEKNYLYNAAYQFLLFFIPVATMPYLSRVLEPDGVGTASYVQSVVAYFVFGAVLGSSTYGQREIAFSQGTMEDRTRVFWEVKSIQVITSVLAILCYFVFSILQDQPILYLVLSFNIISCIADVSWFFQGIEEFGLIVFRNAVIKVMWLVFIFVFIKSPNDLILYLLGTALFELAGNISLWFALPRFINRPPSYRINPIRHIKGIVFLFLPFLAMQLYTVLDKTMIGAITKNAAENGYYEQANKISRMLLSVVAAMGTVMGPRIGKLYSENNLEEIREKILWAYRSVWFLGLPMSVGLCCISGHFIPWFLGEDFNGAIVILRILSWLILFVGFSGITGMQYMVPTKQENRLTASVAIGAVLNILLNLLLIYQFKAVGAAVASLIAEITITVFQFWLVRGQISLVDILKMSKIYLFASGTMGIVLLLIGGYFQPTIMHTFILFAIGLGIYSVILFVCKEPFIRRACGLLFNKICNSNK